MERDINLRLEVGKSYLRNDGEIVFIECTSSLNGEYFYDRQEYGYNLDGTYYRGDYTHKWTLLQEVPQSLVLYLKAKVEEYYSKDSFKTFVDKTFGEGNNDK